MKIRKIATGQQGSIMTVVLLMLILITCIVVYGVMSSRTDVKIVNNERMRKMTFYAAEAGIEAGRAMLDTLRKADAFNWDNLLANNTLVDLGAGRQLIGQAAGVYTLDQALDAVGGRVVGPVTYTLSVTDNNDYDGDYSHDTDDTLILTSVATWNKTTATVQAVVSVDPDAGGGGGGGGGVPPDRGGVSSSGTGNIGS